MSRKDKQSKRAKFKVVAEPGHIRLYPEPVQALMRQGRQTQSQEQSRATREFYARLGGQ